MLNHVFPFPWRFHLASRLLQLYRVSGIQTLVRTTGSPETDCATHGRGRSFDAGDRDRSGVIPEKLYPAEGKKEGTVAFFTGCVMNSMMGSINKASVRLLTAAGYDVMVPAEQICCGALANHAGLRDTAKKMAGANVKAFPVDRLDAIIINAAGCGAMLKEYPLLIDNAGAFSAKVKDISEFLASTRIFERLNVALKGRVGYDDPCHLIHGQGVKSKPRKLLKAIPRHRFCRGGRRGSMLWQCRDL